MRRVLSDVRRVRCNPASPEATDAPRLSSSPDGLALQDDIAPGIDEILPNTLSITEDATRLELEPALRASAGTR